MKQSFRTRLRQMWTPAEFRLPEPEFTADQLDLLEELIQLMSPSFSRAEETMKDERFKTAHFLIELSTGIWRVRRKIEGLSRMPKEIKDALYSLESMWMSMSDGGVEIIDHIGAMPPKHEAVIIEVRETPGIVREQVIDAVKPTVLIHGEVVQQGEVIVGRPAPQQYAAETAQSAAQPNEYEEPSPVTEAENLIPNSPDQNDDSNEAGASQNDGPEPVEEFLSDIPPETDKGPVADDVIGQPADEDKNDGEPEIETAADTEPAIEIPLPKKTTRRKRVLPSSIKTKLAAIPEIGEEPEKEEKKEGTAAPKRGRKRAAARKNGQTETGNSEIDSGVNEEEA